MDRVGELLRDPALAEKAVAALAPKQAQVFAALVLQSVLMGIDYAALGQGWNQG